MKGCCSSSALASWSEHDKVHASNHRCSLNALCAAAACWPTGRLRPCCARPQHLVTGTWHCIWCTSKLHIRCRAAWQTGLLGMQLAPLDRLGAVPGQSCFPAAMPGSERWSHPPTHTCTPQCGPLVALSQLSIDRPHSSSAPGHLPAARSLLHMHCITDCGCCAQRSAASCHSGLQQRSATAFFNGAGLHATLEPTGQTGR